MTTGRVPRAAPALATARHLGVQGVLGVLAGVLGGLGAWAFLEALDAAIGFREERAPWLVWLLPVSAFVTVAAYHHLGGRAGGGTGLVIDQVHDPAEGAPGPAAPTRVEGVPRRMAPFVLLGTVSGHLFGASVGREGTALQISASLADHAARLTRISGRHRRELLVASLAAGFGAVFGVPAAGAVFALEVQTVGRLRFEAVLAAFTAAFVGDRVVRGLGYHHTARAAVELAPDAWTGARVALAGAAFGVAAALFVRATRGVRRWTGFVPYPPARAALGGAVMAVAVAVLGRDYQSLSAPLTVAALGGAAVAPLAWLGKLALTAVCIGSGMPGGEVTPLFVIGALLGATLAGPLGLPAGLLAAVGFVAVFAGAANTPIACTILFVELFGSTSVVLAGLACAVAYACSGHTSIYPTQRIEVRKHR